MKRKELFKKANGLAVFRELLNDDVISKLIALLGASDDDAVKLSGEFAYALYKYGDNLTQYICDVICTDENVCLISSAMGKAVSPVIMSTAEKELDVLEALSQIKPCDISDDISAQWETLNVDIKALYKSRLETVSKTGYGIYERYTAFMLKDKHIVPVLTPDTQRLSELSGYEVERKKLIDNTIALLEGKPAANALLYGNAGTGKSSTVKAVANEFAQQGLRIIELKKSQLHDLPLVMNAISANPLKFIIFIDDLSFSSDDDDFGVLKAVLEGSASAKAENSVIYATSNRVHLVKETFEGRNGNDVHAVDTREQLLSLSERFGLRITFSRPNKDVYLEIVRNLADVNGISMEKEVLFVKAEAFALRKSGRSGRVAKQFIQSLLCQEV